MSAESRPGAPTTPTGRLQFAIAAAPADPENVIADTLNGYIPLADCIPATEEVLSALYFYGPALGFPGREPHDTPEAPRA